jgi:hypothetical protein
LISDALSQVGDFFAPDYSPQCSPRVIGDDKRTVAEHMEMEVNGAGSEAVYAWDPDYSLRTAFAVVFAKQRCLFELGYQMRQRGHKPIDLIFLLQLFDYQLQLIRRYPPSN